VGSAGNNVVENFDCRKKRKKGGAHPNRNGVVKKLERGGGSLSRNYRILAQNRTTGGISLKLFQGQKCWRAGFRVRVLFANVG